MDLIDVKEYIKRIDSVKGADISKLPSGESNDNFLLENDGKKYVLRHSRTDIPSKNFLYNEHIVLLFLESKKISFVPRSIFYDKNKKIHIISYVGSKKLEMNKLVPDQLERLVSNLSKIYFINPDDFVKFCKNRKLKVNKTKSPLYSIRTYGVQRFNYVKKHCNDRSIIDWIEPKLMENVRLTKQRQFSLQNLHFVHGDIPNNIRVDDDEIWIIDWEIARLSYEDNPSYILVYKNISENQRNFIIKKYVKYFKTTYDDLEEKISLDEKTILINDVIWAAMRYVEMRMKDMDGSEKYHKLTLARMKIYDKKYNGSIL